MDEKRYYDEKPETKQMTLVCPHCREENVYPVRWMARNKKTPSLRGGQRRRSREIREGAVLHGAHGRHGRLPQYSLPQTV